MIIGQILFVFFVVIISLVGTFPIEMMVILEAGSESGAPGWFRLRLDHPETQQKQVYISHRIHGAGIYANMTGVY
jgi:hypothetical protein